MFLDKKSQISNAQAITATATSTDSVKTQGNQFGSGDRIAFNMVVGADFTAAGAATLTPTVQYCIDGSTWVDMNSVGPIGKAALLAGKVFKIPVVGEVPTPGGANFAQLRLNYVVTTGPMTAGSVTTWLAAD